MDFEDSPTTHHTSNNLFAAASSEGLSIHSATTTG